MDLISSILSMLFAIFLLIGMLFMVYLFFKKLWEEHLKLHWEAFISGEKESFEEASALLSGKPVEVRLYLHRISYYFLSGIILSLPGYLFFEFLSQKEAGVAILIGLIGYPIIYFGFVFLLGLGLLHVTSIGLTYLLHLPFFSEKLKVADGYIALSLIGLEEMLPIEVWYADEKGKKILYGKLVREKSPRKTSGEFLLQDDGTRFSIGEFQQSLTDGFFYHKREPSKQLYIKKES